MLDGPEKNLKSWGLDIKKITYHQQETWKLSMITLPSKSKGQKVTLKYKLSKGYTWTWSPGMQNSYLIWKNPTIR